MKSSYKKSPERDLKGKIYHYAIGEKVLGVYIVLTDIFEDGIGSLRRFIMWEDGEIEAILDFRVGEADRDTEL